eukprot:3440585-Amphidinium_carterae.1
MHSFDSLPLRLLARNRRHGVPEPPSSKPPTSRRAHMLARPIRHTYKYCPKMRNEERAGNCFGLSFQTRLSTTLHMCTSGGIPRTGRWHESHMRT